MGSFIGELVRLLVLLLRQQQLIQTPKDLPRLKFSHPKWKFAIIHPFVQEIQSNFENESSSSVRGKVLWQSKY